MSVKVDNKLPSFTRNMYVTLNTALADASRDVLIDAKTNAPFRKGQLRGDSSFKDVGILKWRISFFKEYARFQEFGGDGKRVVRNYTTAGTGRDYLKNAGDKQRIKLIATLKKHLSIVRA